MDNYSAKLHEKEKEYTLAANKQLDSFFANSPIEVGDILGIDYIDDNSGLPVLAKYENCKGLPIGISVQSMVNYDLKRNYVNWENNEVQVGSKIQIVSKGLIQLPLPNWELPITQPLYACQKTSRLTWKKVGPLCAEIRSTPDLKGNYKILLEF